MSSIRVTTPQASYDVTIGTGLLRTLYPRLRKLNAGKDGVPSQLAGRGVKPPKTFVVTSPVIWALWHRRFLASFPADARPPVLFLPAGERHKRLATVESLVQQLVLAGADRDSILLAFGGGVVGDVTGFLAAIYMRGIRYVGIPSTILAMVDSSLGGKTGVNLAAGKNLVGAFHHPLAVLSDIDILGTLPPAELRAGLQEAIKAGIIRDPRLFSYLEKNADAILSGDPAALTRVIAASVCVKADVVSQDETESGLRSIAALHVSLNRGRITHEDFARMANLILRYGPIPPFRADPAKLVALTYGDKKKRSGRRAFVLTTGIGATEIAYDVTDAELLAATHAMLATMQQM